MNWYCDTFFNGHGIKQAAREMLALIPPGTKTLLSTGSSGCAIASAILAMSDKQLDHIYVRRPGENRSAHRQDYAGPGMYVNFPYMNPCVIVDDLIATGKSVRRIMKFAKQHGLIVTDIIVGQDKSDYSDDIPHECVITAVEDEWE